MLPGAGRGASGETMKLNQFLMVTAAITVLFGIGLLLVPAQMASIYITSFNAGGTTVARIAGSTLVAFAIVLWCARDMDAAEMRRGVLLGGVIANALNLVIAGQAAMAGVIGYSVGWATVVLHLLLGAGFAYFLLGKR
jgi:hypothetical protein